MPSGDVTVTSTIPVPAGLSTVSEVSLTTVKFVPWFVPKSTTVAPVNSAPVTVTKVPPTAGPNDGVNPVTLVGVIRPSSGSSPNR